MIVKNQVFNEIVNSHHREGELILKNYSNELKKVIDNHLSAAELLPRAITWSEKRIGNEIKDPHRIQVGFIYFNSREMLSEILDENEAIYTTETKKLIKLMIGEYKKSGFQVSKEVDERGVYSITLYTNCTKKKWFNCLRRKK